MTWAFVCIPGWRDTEQHVVANPRNLGFSRWACNEHDKECVVRYFDESRPGIIPLTALEVYGEGFSKQ